MTIAGKHKSKNESKDGESKLREERSEEIFRSVELPRKSKLANISATLKDGYADVNSRKSIPRNPAVSGNKAA